MPNLSGTAKTNSSKKAIEVLREGLILRAVKVCHSSDRGDEEVNASCAPKLPEVIKGASKCPCTSHKVAIQRLPHQVAITNSSKKCPVVTKSGLIIEDRDNDDERDDPVESDDDFDRVLGAFQRDLEVVASVGPAAADVFHFGRVAVQATPRQVSESVLKRLRVVVSLRHEPPNWMERVRLPAGGQFALSTSNRSVTRTEETEYWGLGTSRFQGPASVEPLLVICEDTAYTK